MTVRQRCTAVCRYMARGHPMAAVGRWLLFTVTQCRVCVCVYVCILTLKQMHGFAADSCSTHFNSACAFVYLSLNCVNKLIVTF